MRPLLVLLLVVGALTLAFFAYKAGPGDPGTPALPGLDPTAARTTDQPAAGLVTEAPTRREEVQTREPERQAASQIGDQNVLAGLVIGDGKQEVEGAEVTLTRAGRAGSLFGSENFDRSDDRTTTTNERGHFQFANVAPFKGYSLIVRHPEYATREVGDVNIGQDPRHEEPPIRLQRGGRLYGLVLDSSGTGVAGAKLYLFPGLAEGDLADHPDTIGRESGEDGSYEFRNIGAGSYAVEVDGGEAGQVSLVALAIGPRQELHRDFRLVPGLSIAGRVTSRGRPVEKAAVRVTTVNFGEQQVSRARSDADGAWEVQGLTEGTYSVFVVAEGYVPSNQYPAEAGQTGMAIELAPLPAIHGRVVDAASGEPVPAFEIRLRAGADPGDIPAPLGGFRSRKDPEGTFVVHPPGPGKFVVEAVADGYAETFSNTVTVAPEQTLEGVEVRLSRGGTLRGRVVDGDGKPVRGALVVTHDDDWIDDPFTRSLGDYNPTLATTQDARTNARGEYELTGLNAALYQVAVSHPDYSSAVGRGIRVEDGAEADAQDVVLARGATVRGTVFGPRGDPLVGALVRLTAAETTGGGPYEAKTDAQGQYEIKRIRGGTYLARAARISDFGGTSMADMEVSKATERRLGTASGETYEGVDFHLEAPRER